jgi:hypothetical protein
MTMAPVDDYYVETGASCAMIQRQLRDGHRKSLAIRVK